MLARSSGRPTFSVEGELGVENLILMELKFFFLQGGWGPSLGTPPLAPPPFFTIRGVGGFPILVSNDM